MAISEYGRQILLVFAIGAFTVVVVGCGSGGAPVFHDVPPAAAAASPPPPPSNGSGSATPSGGAGSGTSTGTGSGGTSSSGGTTPSGSGGSSSGTGSSTTNPGVTLTQIQNLPNWESCSVCAGAAGNGPVTDYRMQPGVSSPSLSGSSAGFSVSNTPYGAALWWKQLGGDDSKYGFTYSLDFFVQDPSLPQALEFDANQNAGGSRFVYGTECNLKETGTWRIWNSPSSQWVSTGIPCSVPAANSWNHLQWEFERTTDNQVRFIAVTLNGVRHDVNMNFPSLAGAGSGIDVAFQEDLDGAPHNYTVWVDNVTLNER